MTQHATMPSLYRLSESNLRFDDPAEDIRGRTVVDSEGEDVGEVEDLLLDDNESKVRFLRVASGGFLGIGETTFLIPVDAITGIGDESVRVGHSRQHVAGSPRYDPELVDERYLSTVAAHYGVRPFWGPGYLYPRYPYF